MCPAPRRYGMVKVIGGDSGILWRAPSRRDIDQLDVPAHQWPCHPDEIEAGSGEIAEGEDVRVIALSPRRQRVPGFANFSTATTSMARVSERFTLLPMVTNCNGSARPSRYQITETNRSVGTRQPPYGRRNRLASIRTAERMVARWIYLGV